MWRWFRDEEESMGDRYFLGGSSAQNLWAEGNGGKEGVDREEQVGRRKALTMGTIPKAEGSPCYHPTEESLCANGRSQGVELWH